MKILCVGQNYAKHVAELGFPQSEDPIWFWKPDTCVLPDGGVIRIPTDTGAVEHEVELALRIGPDGQPDAFTVAIDVTARAMQRTAKQAGKPWARSKGYDTFLPLAEWQPIAGVDLQALHLRLAVNGQLKQDAPTSDMTWTVADLLEHAAQWTTLRPGDLFVTGTPHGTSALTVGDTVTAEVVGHVSGTWTVEAR